MAAAYGPGSDTKQAATLPVLNASHGAVYLPSDTKKTTPLVGSVQLTHDELCELRFRINAANNKRGV